MIYASILAALIKQTYWRLVRLRIFEAFWPLALGYVVLASLVISFDILTDQIALAFTFSLIFYLGLIAGVIWGFKRLKWPDHETAKSLLRQHPSGKALIALVDQPRLMDTTSSALWRAEQARTEMIAKDAEAGDVRKLWQAVDPFALRWFLPILLIFILALQYPWAISRMQTVLIPDIGRFLAPDGIRVEGWISPPAYSAEPPVLLTNQAGIDLSTLKGSRLILRTDAPSVPQLVFKGNNTIQKWHFSSTEDSVYALDIALESTGRYELHWWGVHQVWDIEILEDAPPKIRWNADPVIDNRDRLDLAWIAEDDYGIASLDLVISLDAPDAHDAGKKDQIKVIEDMGLRLNSEDERQLAVGLHKWAGQPVEIWLQLSDGSGQSAITEPFEMILPQKLFLQPLARAAMEIRQNLLRVPDFSFEDMLSSQHPDRGRLERDIRRNPLEYAPKPLQYSVLLMDALTHRPEDYFRDWGVYLTLRRARSAMANAKDGGDLKRPVEWLYLLAQRIEYGDLADIEKAYLAAKRAFEKALREGASQDRIERLQKAYQEAAERYIAAKMAAGMKNDSGAEGALSSADLDAADLARMLAKLKALIEAGEHEQARRLLADINALLERLQFQQGSGSSMAERDIPSEDEQALAGLMEKLAELLADQRAVNDDSLNTQNAIRQSGIPNTSGQGIGESGNAGPDIQHDIYELAERQADLNQRLAQLLAQLKEAGEGVGESGGEGAGSNTDRLETAQGLAALEKALNAQNSTLQNLQKDNLDGARQYQDDSAAALRQGLMALAETLDDMRNQRLRSDQGELDPLGRPMQSGGADDGEVDIPAMSDPQLARNILETLRKRLEETDDPEEREYLERLLKRF